MQKELSFYNRYSWLRINIKYGLLLGLLIGTLLCIFRSIIQGQIIPGRSILYNMLFSVVISLSICNSTWVMECLWKLRSGKYWQFIALYYIGCLAGMVIGIELTYVLISFIFHTKYVFLSHPADLMASCFIVLLVCTIIYTYKSQREALYNKIKEKELDMAKLSQLKTEAELQALQSKINPHFLYNALNSIAGLIHEDAGKAEDMTIKLSKLFRYSMNAKHENYATIEEELEAVNTYLDIEKVRFGGRINFEVQVTEKTYGVRIPRFLIQPLVENSLKHGLNNVTTGGKLSVNIYRADHGIVIEVADNGAPFPAELTAGYGLQSTYDKLNLLHPDQYEVQLINHPDKKVRIAIQINQPL
ncbi:sensor histidine kinase [Hufsiella ginkgonis]|uniref:Signal transduction histidine kinase internal region domain-containing protein n=1 Tax=Hufsiella ginkgonis TaxID=2695274 RepID=A0A7K1XUH8_9SPHI|nr:histidine kinase [Hufsiella ginkgonis]MXV14634.1 hypothetical protein [Hufsiella ginkgonis]